jgi:extracellular matrix protein 14
VTNSTVGDELLNGVDYVFVNVVNPDGFVYTWEEDRLWRKNRRYVNYTCTGIDLNRNYAYNWRYSPNSCPTNGYPGSGPLSGKKLNSFLIFNF